MGADDPIRDKYTHAINWDYASHDPQIMRLREQLAREYDAANGIMIPLDPGDTMSAFREIVRRVLDGLAAKEHRRPARPRLQGHVPLPRHARIRGPRHPRRGHTNPRTP